jgi:hypothetical protein
MPPCTGTFGAFKASKPISVKATSNDGEAVFSLSVVVQPRGSDVVMEHWVHSRTDLENGTATWGLESSRVYTLAVMTNRALTVPIGTIVSELARRGLAPALLLNLPSPATAAASSPCGLMPVL